MFINLKTIAPLKILNNFFLKTLGSERAISMLKRKKMVSQRVNFLAIEVYTEP